MLMYYYSYSSVSLFLSSLYVYVSKYKHLLLMSLSLESFFVYAVIYMFFTVYFWIFYIKIFFIDKSLWKSFSAFIISIIDSYSWEGYDFNFW